MHIAMVGVGYVGLVTGACLSDFGHQVICIDADSAKIAGLKAGRIPIYEPGLSEVVQTGVAAGRLSFTDDLVDGVKGAKAIFIAVGTPTNPATGRADLAQVYAVARAVARGLDASAAIIIKSTVPVGTGDEIERIFVAERPDIKVSIISNPEFLREGSAIKDFKLPDRIVVGVEDEEGRRIMTDIYRPLYLNQAPLMFTRRRSSELVKYAANSFLALKVAYINELADLCEVVDADVQDVARGIGLDNRIGSKFLNAGPGFGGSCFPKDLLALTQSAQDAGKPLRIVETVLELNDKRKLAMAEKVRRACGGSLEGLTIGVLGLTFKPNTDDMRSAPSLVIVPELQRMGARVVAFDPKGVELARPLLPGVEFAPGPYECADGVDALVIITEWEAFRALDLPRVKAAMRGRVLVDLRNIYRAEDTAALGFVYEGVGKKLK